MKRWRNNGAPVLLLLTAFAFLACCARTSYRLNAAGLGLENFESMPALFCRKTAARRRLLPQRDRGRQDSRRGGADPAARQAGLFRYVRRSRQRTKQPMTHGYDLPALFHVEADHLRSRDDADRRGQAALDDPVVEIHPVLSPRPKVGVEKKVRTATGRSARAAPAPDHHRRFAHAHIRHHLRFLWRQHPPQRPMRSSISSAAIRTTPHSPIASRSCRSPSSPARCGTTAIPPIFSAASSKSYPGSRCSQFGQKRLLDPFGMTDTAFYVSDPKS